MQNTILTIALTLITTLALVYYFKARKSKSELKYSQPDGHNDKSETKTEAAAAAKL